MPNLGLPELLVVLAIVILLFGVGKLPQLGKGMGEAIRNFKSAMKDGDEEKKDGAGTPPPPQGPK